MRLSERRFSRLVDSIIETESSFNPDAVSLKGATGLMQLMPATGQELTENLFGESRAYNPFDPDLNRYLGSFYFRSLLRRYDDIPLALAAYNWGLGNVGRLLNDEREKFSGSNWNLIDRYVAIRDSLPKETREYVSRVLSRFQGQVRETDAEPVIIGEGFKS
jgi:soluble lytic murein transglycosylase